jgi:hypothetical protein
MPMRELFCMIFQPPLISEMFHDLFFFGCAFPRDFGLYFKMHHTFVSLPPFVCKQKRSDANVQLPCARQRLRAAGAEAARVLDV